MKKLYTFKTWQATRRMFVVFAAALFVFSFVSTASAEGLKTEWADASEVEGTFTLMLYGCAAGSSVDNVAILKKEGEARSFDIAEGPSEGAEVMAGLEGHDALAKAEKFLGCNIDAKHTRLSKIMDSEGMILGFEVKPEYDITKYGTPDLFSTRYAIEGDVVTARVRTDPSIDLNNSGD